MRNKLNRGLALLLSLIVGVAALIPVQAVSEQEKNSYREKIARLDESIALNQQKIDSNKRRKSSAKKDAKGLQEQVQGLQNQISGYNGKIRNLNEKIALMNGEISAQEDRIAALEREMAPTKRQIAAAQQKLGGRMRAAYEAGNISNIQLLLESDSFVEFLNRMEMLDRISRNDNAIIRRLRRSIAGTQKKQDSIRKYQDSIQADMQEVQSAKNELETSKQEIVAKQNELNIEIQKLDLYMSQLDLDSAEAKQSIAEARAAQEVFMDALNGRLSQISSVGTGTIGPGGMIWPVPDSASYISSGYGPRNGGYHYGVDIADPKAKAGQAVAIVAAAAGTVKVASNICTHNYGKHYNCGCNGGYGNYVVIDHGNGLLSYYGHMARALVQTGQRVAQGQIIGIMGSTGFSTGPHCHFEICVNNGQSRSMAARNPLAYVGRH